MNRNGNKLEVNVRKLEHKISYFKWKINEKGKFGAFWMKRKATAGNSSNKRIPDDVHKTSLKKIRYWYIGIAMIFQGGGAGVWENLVYSYTRFSY